MHVTTEVPCACNGKFSEFEGQSCSRDAGDLPEPGSWAKAQNGSWTEKAGGGAEIHLQEGQSARRQPPSAEAQEQRFPEVTGTGVAHSESQSQHFPPLMGDPTNPQDTLFLFVFFPCQVSGLTELPPGD